MADAMPKVKSYPICSECRTPYVLRRCWSIMDGGKTVWLWQRDCKHKRAVPLASTSPALRKMREATNG